jgi:hypothetical protein
MSKRIKQIASGGQLVLMNLPDISIDDLLIALNSSTALKQTEILEFIKILASQQSNPPFCVAASTSEVEELIHMRPSLWVKQNLHILETTELKHRNDKFVMAAARGNMKIIEKLISMGQDLVAVHTDLGYTALHAACDFGQLDVVHRLLSIGMAANIRDMKRGQTPLHYAAKSGRQAICKLLIGNGADRTLPNSQGLRAYELAHEFGFIDCRESLKQPPPEINEVRIVQVTPYTVTISWQPPGVVPEVNATVIDYAILTTPVTTNGDAESEEESLYTGNQLPESGSVGSSLGGSLTGSRRNSGSLFDAQKALTSSYRENLESAIPGECLEWAWLLCMQRGYTQESLTMCIHTYQIIISNHYRLPSRLKSRC